MASEGVGVDLPGYLVVRERRLDSSGGLGGKKPVKTGFVVDMYLKVIPNAPHSSLCGSQKGCHFGVLEGNPPRLKWRVAAKAEDGKATKELVKSVSRFFSLPEAAVTVICGERARLKTLQLEVEDMERFVVDILRIG